MNYADIMNISQYHKKKYLLFTVCILLFSIKTGANENNNPVAIKGDDLARVAILAFDDRTNSNNFQYMAESLSDAINYSMLKEFTYIRIDKNELNKSTYWMQYQNLISVGKKIENSDQEGIQDKNQQNLVKKIAKDVKSDIIIFGNYSYDLNTNELVLTANLYLALSDGTKKINSIRNVVDNTLFNATALLAKNLVAEIHSMIEEAEQKNKNTSNKAEEDIKKPKPGEKTALTRKVAMAPTFDWTTKKLSVTLLPGFYMNNSPSSGCGVCQLQVTLAARFWVIQRLYFGIALDSGIIERSAFPFSAGMPSWVSLDGIAFVGYSIPVQRWLFSADIGAGYYLIIDSSEKMMYYNPAFGARIGAEVLLTPVFSLGLAVNAHLLYDDPKMFLFGGLGVSLNFNM